MTTEMFQKNLENTKDGKRKEKGKVKKELRGGALGGALSR